MCLPFSQHALALGPGSSAKENRAVYDVDHNGRSSY
jgi:hypothetical protein